MELREYVITVYSDDDQQSEFVAIGNTTDMVLRTVKAILDNHGDKITSIDIAVN